MAKDRRFYWDSCVFIHALQRTEELEHVLRPIIEEAQAGGVQIVTSAVTLAEVIRVKRSSEQLPNDMDEQVIADLFRNDYINVRVVDPATATAARRIARDHGLSPMDAIHVATAVDAKTPVMHTFDGRKKSRGLIPKSGKIGQPPLRIEEPQWTGQTKMFTEDGGSDDRQQE